ncbi:MAG: type II toxin-antitoxin system RelE/ParE family toxin [Acidobacteria bacterium]|nr:type II toxin-antitoxin system RelE/ParE family toxin [Acidobacteriota bacterium]
MKIRWTATALSHLKDLPREVGEEILRKVRTAAAYPLMYPERQRGRYRGCRWFPVSFWLVFYRTSDRGIIVVGIWHGARKEA